MPGSASRTVIRTCAILAAPLASRRAGPNCAAALMAAVRSMIASASSGLLAIMLAAPATLMSFLWGLRRALLAPRPPG
jgi:hypothetical protein